MNWFTKDAYGRGISSEQQQSRQQTKTSSWCRFLASLLGAGLALACSAAAPLLAQSPDAIPLSNQVTTPQGLPAVNAAVRVCLITATGSPCSTAGVTLYTDPNLSHATSNPTATNQYGNYNVFTTTGAYMLQVTPSGATGPTYTYYYINGTGSAGTGITINGGSALPSPVNFENTTGAGGITITNPSAGNVQATLLNSSININGVTAALGATVQLPPLCAGFNCTNYDQNNPNFTTTAIFTTASITSTSTTIPVNSTTGWASIGCGYLTAPVEGFCWDSITSTSLILNNVNRRGINGYTAAAHSGANIIGAFITYAPSPTAPQSFQVTSTGQIGFTNGINPGLTDTNFFNGSTQFSGQVNLDSRVVAGGGLLLGSAVNADTLTSVSSLGNNATQSVNCVPHGTAVGNVCNDMGAWVPIGGGSGTVTGSGTTGFFTQWTGTTAVGNSPIDNGQTTTGVLTAALPLNIEPTDGVDQTSAVVSSETESSTSDIFDVDDFNGTVDYFEVGGPASPFVAVNTGFFVEPPSSTGTSVSIYADSPTDTEDILDVFSDTGGPAYFSIAGQGTANPGAASLSAGSTMGGLPIFTVPSLAPGQLPYAVTSSTLGSTNIFYNASGDQSGATGDASHPYPFIIDSPSEIASAIRYEGSSGTTWDAGIAGFSTPIAGIPAGAFFIDQNGTVPFYIVDSSAGPYTSVFTTPVQLSYLTAGSAPLCYNTGSPNEITNVGCSGSSSAITLTTTGTSGPATYISGTLNVPEYVAPSGAYLLLNPTSTQTVSLPNNYSVELNAVNTGNYSPGDMTMYMNNNGPGFTCGTSGTACTGWSSAKGIYMNLSDSARGIMQGISIAQNHNGQGDTAGFYEYLNSFGGQVASSDEAVDGARIDSHQKGAPTGVVAGSPAAGAITITTGSFGCTYGYCATFANNNSWDDGGIVLNKTQTGSALTLGTQSTYNGGISYVLTSGTVTPSTAWGVINDGTCTPNGNGQWQAYTETTCNVNLLSGTFTTSGGTTSCASAPTGTSADIGLVGSFQEESYVVAVGSPSAGVQSVSFCTRYAWNGGTNLMMQGGPIGTAIVVPVTFTGATTVSSTTVSTSAINGTLIVGQTVVGSGIPSGDTIATVGSGVITLTAAATVTATGVALSAAGTSVASGWPIAYMVVGATSSTTLIISNCLTGTCDQGQIPVSGTPVTTAQAAFIIGTASGGTAVNLGTNSMAATNGDILVGAPTSQYLQTGLIVNVGQETPWSSNQSGGINCQDDGPFPAGHCYQAQNNSGTTAYSMFNVLGGYDYEFLFNTRPTTAMMFVENVSGGNYDFFRDYYVGRITVDVTNTRFDVSVPLAAAGLLDTSLVSQGCLGTSSTGLLQACTIPWATPGTIGSTTPNTGAFTTLTSSGTTSLAATTTIGGNAVCLATGANCPSATSPITGGTLGRVAIFGSATSITSGIALGTTGSDIPQLSSGLLVSSIVPWVNPGAIGSGTASTGAFTTLSTTGVAALGAGSTIGGTAICLATGTNCPATGISGLTSGQVAIAGSATTIASSVALGSSGSDIPQLSSGLLNPVVVPWATPGTIGSTAPNTGAFTTLTATGGISVGSSPPTACGSATGCFALGEAATAGTPTAGADYFRASSSTHQILASLNAGSEFVSLMNFSTVNLASSAAGGVTGLLPNANLANVATTVNGQTCTLGSTCTVATAISNPITSATGGSGISAVTCSTTTCTNLRGTYTMTATTVSTETILTLVWPTTTNTYACTVGQNGGVTSLGLGHSVATATGMTISVAVAAPVTGSIVLDYECQP